MPIHNALTRDERYRIYKLWCFGYDSHAIAKKTGRSRAVIVHTIRETELESDWRDWPVTQQRHPIPPDKRDQVLECRTKGWSCVKIAEVTGVSKSAVQRIVSGHAT